MEKLLLKESVGCCCLLLGSFLFLLPSPDACSPLEGQKESLLLLLFLSREAAVKRKIRAKKSTHKKVQLFIKNGSKRGIKISLPQTPLATAEPSAGAAPAADEGAAAATSASSLSSSPLLLPPFPPAPPAAAAAATAFAAAAASAAAAAAPAGLVMSWIDALRRSLLAPPEAKRMKYFWAWEATCVGVRVVTQLFFFFFFFAHRGEPKGEKVKEKRKKEKSKKEDSRPRDVPPVALAKPRQPCQKGPVLLLGPGHPLPLLSLGAGARRGRGGSSSNSEVVAAFAFAAVAVEVRRGTGGVAALLAVAVCGVGGPVADGGVSSSSYVRCCRRLRSSSGLGSSRAPSQREGRRGGGGGRGGRGRLCRRRNGGGVFRELHQPRVDCDEIVL